MATRQQYLENVKTLSDQLLAIQAPIRILDSIKWPAQWRQKFFDTGMRSLPQADTDYYQSIPLNFDPDAKQQELKQLCQRITRTLGKKDPLAKLLRTTTKQYITVIDLLKHRGLPQFGDYSVKLYGSAQDHLFGDKRSLLEVAEQLCAIFSQPAVNHIAFEQPKLYDAPNAVKLLQQRLNTYFTKGELKVVLSDGIVSDAAAGGDSIKMNNRSRFSERDLRVLEVHEGWVHVGTTLNGRHQPWARQFKRVIAVDVSSTMLDEAKKVNAEFTNIEYQHNISENLERIPSASIDFVFSLIVLQHMPKNRQIKYLQEFCRILSPGGVLAIQTPARCNFRRWKGWIYFLMGNSVLNIVRRIKHGANGVMEVHTLSKQTVLDVLNNKHLQVLSVDQSTAAGIAFEDYMYIARRP